MRLPKKLNIYGLPYTVTGVSGSMAEVSNNEGAPCWGVADILNKRIAIFTGNKRTQVAPEQMLNTLIHEITHIVIAENSALAACLKDGAEEAFTDGFAVNMTDTLTRNGLAVGQK